MQEKQILHFLTAGSVDDGKSTLIGRLLYDCHALPQDILAHLQKQNHRLPDGSINLALLTDGLRAEREQGITIDVAYKYFSTNQRKYIIADTPGHVQYTRNMVTGASHSDLVILLVDARQGITEQTRRHAFLALLLGIQHLVVAINKMDLVQWSQARFLEISLDFQNALEKIQNNLIRPWATTTIIPLSALHGDNIVHRSTACAWYTGKTLLHVLENTPISSTHELAQPLRFPIQTVIRPQSQAHPDFRGYAGRVSSGTIQKGDRIIAYPSLQKSHVQEIIGPRGPQMEAIHGESITITLTDSIDLSRGDLLCIDQEIQPTLMENMEAWITWFDDIPLQPGSKWLLRFGPTAIHSVCEEISQILDLQSLELQTTSQALARNSIAMAKLSLAGSIAADSFAHIPATGRFIIIHEGTNRTVGAGLVQQASYTQEYLL